MNLRTSEGQHCVSDLVSKVSALTRSNLIARWEKHYGTLPHKLTSTRLLVMAVAYAVQVEQQGGLPKRTRKELLRVAEGQGIHPDVKSDGGNRRLRSGTPQADRRARLRPGARFVREWNGRTHVVEVVDKGFAWQGQVYRSLSAVATLITGTRWSGPRFFGLAA